MLFDTHKHISPQLIVYVGVDLTLTWPGINFFLIILILNICQHYWHILRYNPDVFEEDDIPSSYTYENSWLCDTPIVEQ
jgi:hypothetical protein